MKNITITTLVVIAICFLGVSRADAGTLFPSTAPGTSMYSLQELYNLVTASTTSSVGDGSVIYVPSVVGNTMITMTDLYNAILALKNASSSDDNATTTPELSAGYLEINFNVEENQDTYIEVNENTDTPDIFVYSTNIMATSSNITVNSITVNLEITDGVTSNLEDIVEGVHVVLNGDEVGSENASTTIVFDDINTLINKNNSQNIEVTVDLNSQNGNYDNYDSFKISGIEINYTDELGNQRVVVENSDGGVMSMILSGIVLESTGNSVRALGANEAMGEFDINFEVNVIGDDDIYIPTTFNSAYVDVMDSNGVKTTATTSSISLDKSSGGSVAGDYYKISTGSVASFRLRTIVNNTGGGDRALKVGLTGIEYKVGTTGATTEVYDIGTDEDYQTSSIFLFNSDQNN